MGAQYTTHEHYIPQCVLKQHRNVQCPYKTPHLYIYDKELGWWNPQLQSVEKVAFIDYLYEFRDMADHVNLYAPDFNYLESNILYRLENHAAKTWIYKIVAHQPLDDKDCYDIKVFITNQRLRMPDIIERATDFLSNYLKTYDRNVIRNFALYSMLWKPLDSEYSVPWMRTKLSVIVNNLNVRVWHSDELFIISDNCPVLGIVNVFRNTFETLIFPISSHECIALTINPPKEQYQDISSDFARMINRMSYDRTTKFFYCAERININDKCNIVRALAKR